MTKDEAVKAYDQLVLFRQQNQLQKTTENPGKVETHHIRPISCGGEDAIENRINLFAKEHLCFSTSSHITVILRNPQTNESAWKVWEM